MQGWVRHASCKGRVQFIVCVIYLKRRIRVAVVRDTVLTH
jgi:hypothetical protein